jgi:mRNA interferase YafQ
MLTTAPTTRFLKDAKLASRRGKDLRKLEAVIALLATQSGLPDHLRDHSLTGDWKGFRDCHIEPDWLLIYKTDTEHLHLARTGTHSDLFAR